MSVGIARSNWQKKTNRDHIVILLDCSRDENARRIQSVDRDAKRKTRDPKMFRTGEQDRPFIDRGADRLLRLDITNMLPDQATQSIVEWLLKA